MRPLLPALALVAVLAGCSADAGDGRPQVAVAAYPFAWLVQQVGGTAVQVVDLSRSGVDPHELELGPRQVARLQSADLVVALKGFQPALDDAVPDPRALLDLGRVLHQQRADSSLGDDEGAGLDPHVWLDPVLMEQAATALGARLEPLAPGSAARASALVRVLTALDARFRQGLAGCARTDLVTSHTAFGYLARRYGLQQVGVTGTDPEGEPSPGRLAAVVRFARAHGVTTVFTAPGETKVADTVARELGARTATLSTLEAAPATGDYVTVMDADLAALRTGLGCA